MVKQTPILFKADSEDLAKLDSICFQLGVKRNKLLNFYLHYGVQMMHDPIKLQFMSVYERSMFFSFMK